ncbi:MAG: hypothetical protein FWF92_04935 [Oscillospiraceae bacterium]|nr:hypothetical protein [Oscillospiraceae bacterium]
MKYKTLIRPVFLIFVLIIFVFLFSCSGENKNTDINDGNKDNKNENIAEDAENGDNINEEADHPISNLPNIDWEGKEIKFLVRGDDFYPTHCQDIYAESETGEPVNDAVYKRNTILEDRYNIKILSVKESQVPGLQTHAEKSILADSNDFQVSMCSTPETIYLASKGYLSDLRKVKYLDVTREYWDQNSVYGFTIYGKTLFMTGDLSIMANDATWILMFNKNLLKDLNLADPYELVKANQWTADKMYELMCDATIDLDGDGKITKTDQFGFTTHDSTYDGLFFGLGMRFSVMDKNGYPEIFINNERITRVMEKTIMLMDKSVTYNADWQIIAKCFQENRALFYGEVLQCVIRLRDMDTPFGVLPFPKLDEFQEDYAHMVHDTACMVGIPNNLSSDEIDFAGFTLEAIAAESGSLLVPAYYKIALEGKFLRDEESSDMLDIILRTRCFDLGYKSNWGGLFSNYVNNVRLKKTDFMSIWEKNEAKVIADMEKAVETYKDIS